MKKNFRLLSVALSIILILNSFLLVTYAEETTSSEPAYSDSDYLVISFDDPVVNKDGTVDVNIYITQNPGIIGAKLTFNYRKKYLTLISAENGTVFGDGDISIKRTSITVDVKANSNNTGTGLLASYHFSLTDTATGYSEPLMFDLYPEYYLAANITKFDTDENGAIVSCNVPIKTGIDPVYSDTIKTYPICHIYYLKGDVNLDKTINAKDVLQLRRYLVSLDTLTEYQLRLADLSEDSAYNATDLLMLRKMLIGVDIGHTYTYSPTWIKKLS